MFDPSHEDVGIGFITKVCIHIQYIGGIFVVVVNNGV